MVEVKVVMAQHQGRDARRVGNPDLHGGVGICEVPGQDTYNSVGFSIEMNGLADDGRVGGKPNNNCAPDRLVETTAEFGRTARVPMLWIYTENDTYFGPALSQRMATAFQAGGGNLEYHLLPPFGHDGHFLVDSADGVRIWTPMVDDFLTRHR